MGNASVSPSSEMSNHDLFRRLLALSWRYRGHCGVILLLQTLLLVIGLGGLGLTGVGIDFIRHCMDAASPPARWPFGISPPDTWSPMQVIVSVGIGILCLALIRGSIRYCADMAVARLVQGKIVVDLRAAVYDRLQRLSFRFYDENESASIINRVTRDVQATRMFIDTILVQGLMTFLSLTVFFLYMISIHVPLTFACLATSPLLLLVSLRFSRLIKPAYRRQRDLVDHLILVLSESMQGIRVIKGFAGEPQTRTRFERSNRQVRNQGFMIFHRVCSFGAIINFLSNFSIFVLIGYGGCLVMSDVLPLGAGLVVFCGLLQQFSGQVSSLVQLTNQIQDCLAGARRVFEVLEAPIEIANAEDPKPLRSGEPFSIEFENVTFGYTPEKMVLKHVSFRVSPGQCVAIVGATGSGKTSLLSLIPRFYDPSEGVVRINGVDIKEVNLEELRRSIGFVFQESFLFSHRIGANIAFGQSNAKKERIVRAARIAAAHDFIMEMPDGYETMLGERGAGISGGQSQRISIARAVLLDPSILLLDDPTAAIDSETEHEILEAMENAMRGRTTFIVAHRLNTLKKADLILVLDQGEIVQRGTHAELAESAGPYQDVVRCQMIDHESRKALAAGERSTDQ